MKLVCIRSAALSALTVAALALACGGDSRSGHEGPKTAPPPPSLASGVGGVDRSFQAKILNDGQVTFAEYDEAFLAYVSCAGQRGWVPVAPPRLTSRRLYDYQFTRPNSDPAAGASERARWEGDLRTCEAMFFDEVQRAWVVKTAPSQQELQAARDALGACLRDAQVSDVPAHPTAEDWERFIVVSSGATLDERKVFRTCLTAVQGEYGIRSGEVP